MHRWTLEKTAEGYKQTQEHTHFLYPFDQPELRKQLQSHVSPFCLAWNAGKKLAKYDANAMASISTSPEDLLDFLPLIQLYTAWSDASQVPADFLDGTRSTSLPVGSIQFPSESEDDDWDKEITPPAATKRQRTVHLALSTGNAPQIQTPTMAGKTRKLPRDHLTKVRSLRPVIIPLAEKSELQSPLQINQCYTTGK